MKKPIKVFYSTLSDKFYATQHWKEIDGGVVVLGEKFDVTQDIAAAIVHHGVTFKRKSGSKNK